jgi:hypothetical protein
MASTHREVKAVGDDWPALPLGGWRDTYSTLHRYVQVLGKVRLALSPMMNEWWQVPLYVTARGLGTSPIPHDRRTFEMDLDFIDHELVIRVSDGAVRSLALMPRTVADFYAEVMLLLDGLGLSVAVSPVPSEVRDATPLDQDHAHADYDAEAVGRFWEIVRRLDVVFKRFRARFTGKASPVHFFWGSFDLAVSRFSGRAVPPRPGAGRITRVAYDEEVSSVGFWPGGAGGVDEPALYSYTSPEPPGFAEQPIEPASAYYCAALHELILPYEEVRRAPRPEDVVLAFAQSAYEAGARLSGWDRAALERPFERLAA